MCTDKECIFWDDRNLFLIITTTDLFNEMSESANDKFVKEAPNAQHSSMIVMCTYSAELHTPHTF